jgi:hypothetical protein
LGICITTSELKITPLGKLLWTLELEREGFGRSRCWMLEQGRTGGKDCGVKLYKHIGILAENIRWYAATIDMAREMNFMELLSEHIPNTLREFDR